MTHQYTCPVCGEHKFQLDITQTALVIFQEDEEHEVIDIEGDAEWDDKTPAMCTGCGHDALLGEMKGRS